MGFFSSLGLRLPGSKSNWSPSWLASIGVNPATGASADEGMTPAKGFSLSPLYKAVALYADILSSIPIKVVLHLPTGGKKIIKTGELVDKLNLWKMEQKEVALVQMLLGGNGFWDVKTLKPIDSWRVTIDINEQQDIFYKICEDGLTNSPARTLAEDEVIHLKYRLGSGTNSLYGIAPLQSCADAVQLAFNIRSAGNYLFKNSSLPSGTLNTDMELNAEQASALRQRWEQQSSGKNAGKTPVLSHGLKAQPSNNKSALDIQLVEMTKLGVSEIARAYSVPVSLLAEDDLNRSAGEEIFRAWTLTSLTPMVSRFSDVLTFALLSDNDIKKGYRIEEDLSAQLLPFGEERASYLSKMSQSVMTLNECRNLIDLEDIAGGEEMARPVNTIPHNNWLEFAPNNSNTPDDKKQLLEAVFTPDVTINKKSLFESIYK